MATKWTTDQQNAIEARDGTLLVSAAAGSGKTAVLVERVIQRLTDPEDPTPVDRLLIVTFTKAAAAEMRSRLSASLDKALRDDPENTLLQRQKMLLPSAQIGTIDSFCSSLVREHFDVLGIDPDYRILDSSDVSMLQHTAVSRVVSEYYESGDPIYRDLVELLLTGRDDTPLEENILRLHAYSRTYPSPSAWLHHSVDLYDPEHLEDSEIITVVTDTALEYLDWVLKQEDRLLQEFETRPDLTGCPLHSQVAEGKKRASEIAGYIKKHQFAEAVERSQKKDPSGNDTYKNLRNPITKKKQKDYDEEDIGFAFYAKELQKSIRDGLDQNIPKMLPATLQETEEDCKTLRPIAKKLVEAVEAFDSLYSSLKREQNALDFPDVELLALQLLVKDPSAETPVFTPLAQELSEQYDEILLDECQDMNRLQDLLFRALSKEESNLFMVGDVKQSIYQFRQASPELFIERQEQYPIYDPAANTYPAKVILGKNFRSREGVLDTVNYMFRPLMSKSCGDLVYDKNEELIYGSGDRFPKADRPDAEYLFLNGTPQDEAEQVAKRILEMRKEAEEKGTPLKYSDFSILLRSPGSSAKTYEKALAAYGIPVYSNAGEKVLETVEIRTILAFLQIVDNPMQDIPLLAVLLSSIYGFTPDEVAALRVREKKTIGKDGRKEHANLYSCLVRESENNPKCEQLLRDLRHYRKDAAALPAGELLREILEEKAWFSIVRAKPNGEQRVSNLNLLLHYADSYDTYRPTGLSGFLRYMEQVIDNGDSPQSISAVSPNADVVTIMSIHRSKGLQFKVCFVSDCGHGFNDEETRKSLILHPTLGIGLKGRNPENGNTYPTLFHTAVKEAVKRRSRSESLRLLYVGMTRAEEVLIVTGSARYLDSAIHNAGLNRIGNEIHPYTVGDAGNFLSWIITVLLRHPNARALREAYADRKDKEYKSDFFSADWYPFEFTETTGGLPISVKVLMDPKKENEDPATETLPPFKPDEQVFDNIKTLTDTLSFTYEYAGLSGTESKRTASKGGAKDFDSRNFAKSKPGFLSKEGLTSAEKGTAQHKFMQYADFAKAETDADAERIRLTERGLLTEKESAAIRVDQLEDFFRSDLYHRIKLADAVYREKQFAVLRPASESNPDLTGASAEEKVLVQGVVDCAFEENGGLVILDYKTDHINEPEKFVEEYADQLKIYARAMHAVLGLPIKQIVLYSFHLSDTIDLPIPEDVCNG